MKREAKLLFNKSSDSLLLSIEHFNRPTDRGRPEAVLIFLDRAFELLLKACIVHRGGRIREIRARETIGFDKCVRKCLSDAQCRCLTDEQALTIQIINSLRDAAQHYVLEISEQQLYLYAQAGLTLFGQLVSDVLGKRLKDLMPARVLPVTTEPPLSLAALIEAEFKDILALARPGSRKRLEARARVRTLAIIEASVGGVRSQPSKGELDRVIDRIVEGKRWQDVFPGVATLELDTSGTGLTVTVSLTKSKGEPVHLVPEGTPGATVVAVKRVDELSYYSLGLHQLADKLRLTQPKAVALVRHQRVQESVEYFKEVRIGKATFKRYSPRALDLLKRALEEVDMDDVWARHGTQPRAR